MKHPEYVPTLVAQFVRNLHGRLLTEEGELLDMFKGENGKALVDRISKVVIAHTEGRRPAGRPRNE